MFNLDLIGVTEIQDGIAESVADFLQEVYVEVVVSELSLVGSAETSFQSEGVRDAHLFPHDDSCGGFLGTLNCEGAVSKVEDITVLVH